MYTMIIEQTIRYPFRMEYNPDSETFHETSYRSLFHDKECPYPYGWIRESGTPPQRHLDVILVSDEAYELGNSLAVMVIGVFKRADGDHKLVAVPLGSELKDFKELSVQQHENLKRLYPSVDVGEGWFGAHDAKTAIDYYFETGGQR